VLVYDNWPYKCEELSTTDTIENCGQYWTYDNDVICEKCTSGSYLK
jgi:hypothetical protein